MRGKFSVILIYRQMSPESPIFIEIKTFSMAFYFMAGISIRDREEYQRYLDGTDKVFAQYDGEYLAVDEHPEVLEGQWDSERAVLIRFETKEDFEAWYRSDAYQEILKHRLKAAECNSILIRGKD